MGTFLVWNVQTGDCSLVILGDFFSSLLERNFVDFLDEFSLGVLENIGVFVTLVDEFLQLLVIAINVHFLHIRTKDFSQLGDGKHIFWDCRQKDGARGDLRGDFWSSKIFLTSFLEEQEFASEKPENESYS